MARPPLPRGLPPGGHPASVTAGLRLGAFGLSRLDIPVANRGFTPPGTPAMGGQYAPYPGSQAGRALCPGPARVHAPKQPALKAPAGHPPACGPSDATYDIHTILLPLRGPYGPFHAWRPPRPGCLGRNGPRPIPPGGGLRSPPSGAEVRASPILLS